MSETDRFIAFTQKQQNICDWILTWHFMCGAEWLLHDMYRAKGAGHHHPEPRVPCGRPPPARSALQTRWMSSTVRDGLSYYVGGSSLVLFFKETTYSISLPCTSYPRAQILGWISTRLGSQRLYSVFKKKKVAGFYIFMNDGGRGWNSPQEV